MIPVLMLEMFFDSGTIRLWSGIGELTYNGNVFIGAGNLIGISPIEETEDLQAKGLVITLNGISSSLIAIALGEKLRGRQLRLYQGMVNDKRYVATEDGTGKVKLEDSSGFVLLENNFIDSPYRLFSGLMDVMEFTDNGTTATLRLSVESNMIIGQRAKIGRYTNEDQKAKFPNDKGLEFINQLQDKEIVW